MSVLALDIGSFSLKYVLTRKKKPVLCRSLPFYGNIDELDSLLQQIRKEIGLSVEVRVVLTSLEILKRTFTLPQLPKEELKEAAKWSLSKMLPDPLEEYIYHFDTLGTIDEKGVLRQEMYFLGAKKEVITGLTEIFERNGFKNLTFISDVIVPFIHIGRLLKKVRENFGILDIGGRHTDFYIFKDGTLRMAREMLTSSESFTDALVSHLKVSFSDGEDQKIKKGFCEEFEPVFIPVFERLVGEISRTIAVYNQRYPDAPCEHIYITGGGTRLKGLEEKLKESLPVSLESLKEYFPVEEDYIPAYVLSISDPLLNLLPEEKIGALEKKRWFKVGAYSSAAIIFLLFLGSFYIIDQKKRLDMELGRELRLIEEKKEVVRSLENLPIRLKELEGLLQEIKRKDRTFIFLLKSLSFLTPKELYVKELNFEKIRDKKTYVVEIKGISSGAEAEIEGPLIYFLFLLEKEGVLKNPMVVEKNVKDLGKRKIVEFVIRGECEEKVEI